MFRRALREYMEHYHLERNHQGLDNNLIAATPVQCSTTERIDCRSRLGGILRFYERAVAGITTLSSREFNQVTGRAKKATRKGPVFITDRADPHTY
jgi:hypothetical protein